MLVVSVLSDTSRSYVPELQKFRTRPRKEEGNILFTVNLLEHLPHPLNIVMIQEPCLGIFLVLLERDGERIGHIHSLAIVLTK